MRFGKNDAATWMCITPLSEKSIKSGSVPVEFPDFKEYIKNKQKKINIAKERNNMSNKEITVGAVNWDCSLPDETFFGFYSAKSLSPEKFRSSTPYYAIVEGSNKICYHYRSLEEYEREMQYAIDAGIDYFAYCWYGENPKHREYKWQENLYALTYARKMHIKSSLKNRIKLCAIIGVGAKEEELSAEDMIKLAEEMKQDYYQKIDGRPLVYVFDGYKQETSKILSEVCDKRGTPKPYFVFMCSETSEIKVKKNGVESAVCEYAFPQSAKNYDEFISHLIDDLKTRYKLGINVIPQFSLGWNPSPRIENSVPWCNYEDKTYLPQITKEELLQGAEKFTEYLVENKEHNTTNQILIFAWNEFEEGGYICPTYDDNGKNINTDRVRALAHIVSEWKKKI